MSGDEFFAAVVCLIATGTSWISWTHEAAIVARRSSGFRERWLLLLAPAACAALLYWVLRNLAADDVRTSSLYIAFYLLMGAAWVGVAVHWLAFLGLSLRDDVVERANRAAGVALAGALVGITLCFAGGNIGNGPGWWVVVFSAALSTGTLFWLWRLLHRLTGAAETVTVDRDRAAGLRAAGFFVAGGLILGRAVAGDWESAFETVVDFAVVGWPVVVLFAVAAFLERTFRPTPEEPAPSVAIHGWVPFLVEVAAAVFYVRWLGGLGGLE